MITRMVSKFHVEPREVDRSFAVDVFNTMLDKTDRDRIFFLNSDIGKLNEYSTTLHIQIQSQKTAFLSQFISIYQQRLKQADSLVNEISKKPFNLDIPEKLTKADRDAYPASKAEMQLKLYKKLKGDVLYTMVDDMPAGLASYPPARQKVYVDSAEVVLRKKTAALLKREIGDILQSPYGPTGYIGNVYCETIAACFDPHTEFFPPVEKENFESELGKQRFEFGFKIKADKYGGVLIDNLQPGSPAFKSGKMNKGDKFISVQLGGGAVVDIADLSPAEFGTLLDKSNDKKALFTIKKADGSISKVSLQKEQVAGDDDDKVKSFILKGDNTVGYIYLPAFYGDWDVKNDGLNGCANDVGREILKLKKENISGLILDLRYNGGGSIEEAAELAGIFIDAGPVQQVKGQDKKVYVIKDVNRGTIYDGPLVIMVNGYSASASELVAGTLQDYNRAVIIGSATYGKATEQVILPLDTTVTPETIVKKQTENSIKVTIGKIYRVNGTTAQFTGVQPDIVLPDVLDAYIDREADQPFALHPDLIAANKYYTPYTFLPIKTLAEGAKVEIDTSKYFNAVKSFIAYSKQQKQVQDISLSLKQVLALNQAEKKNYSQLMESTASKRFTVKNNRYEAERLQTDTYLKELNEEFVEQVSTDPYINVAYSVLSQLKP